MDITSYHIEKVSNGYIVSEDGSRRDAAMRGVSFATRPPHVFQTFDAMSKWLSSALELQYEKKNSSQ